MKYIEIKACPICGAVPEKELSDMGRPGGHGYPGNFSYHYECPNCKLLKGITFTDLYYPSAEAIKQAKQSWNSVCESVQTYLDKIYVRKTN